MPTACAQLDTGVQGAPRTRGAHRAFGTLTLDDDSGPASEVDFAFAVGSRFNSLDLGDAAIGLAAAINADAARVTKMNCAAIAQRIAAA